MAKKEECLQCRHNSIDPNFFYCEYYNKKMIIDSQSCDVYCSINKKEVIQNQGCGLILIKLLYLILSLAIAVMGLATLREYLRTIEAGSLSAVMYMGLPIVIYSGLILFLPFKLPIKFLNRIIDLILDVSSVEKLGILRKFLAVLVNIIILFFFLILSSLSSFAILFGFHLYSSFVFLGILIFFVGLLGTLISYAYFRKVNSCMIFLKVNKGTIDSKKQSLNISTLEIDKQVNCALDKIMVEKRKNISIKTRLIKCITRIYMILKMRLDGVIDRKILFPFNKGIQRLLIVFWLGVSILVEILNWEDQWGQPLFRHFYLSELSHTKIIHYCCGLVPFLMIPIIYFIIIWVYSGFNDTKNGNV